MSYFGCLQVEASGDVMIGGFTDGVLRMFVVCLRDLEKGTKPSTDDYVHLICVTKPHTKPITFLTVNPAGDMIVTGSEDATCFFFRVVKEPKKYISLVPIGCVKVQGVVTYITWKPEHYSTVLVSYCC